MSCRDSFDTVTISELERVSLALQHDYSELQQVSLILQYDYSQLERVELALQHDYSELQTILVVVAVLSCNCSHHLMHTFCEDNSFRV